PTRSGDAKLTDGLVADLRAKLTQSLVSRRDFARIGIDEIHAGERELIAPLCHNMTGTSGGLEMARVCIRLGGRMTDGRDALDFKPIITIPDLDLKFASQELDERHRLSHSFSVLRGRVDARPKVEREHVSAVLVRPQTNRPRLDRP